ncbi:MCE family protein [Mycolicibacterium pulveris]|uniref:Virulence factor Mce family protein n=1 Tax=Mycolicibacterium pulveris TaxID=36813 RepID=A0A7I7UGC8_MYCPV|nr:MCE family protein [Mycolicibacterium pulveris]MCV6981784.1 MCE family protein [Mycolicibacterium pulveris]BBY79216.1 virulence factor Mce family protein [Mycolicibacterium pulveris]
MTRTLLRPLVGLVAIVVAVVVVVLAANLFRGGFIDSVPVTVITQRAGLVMNPDAKVKVRGVQVGTVAVIEELPDGAAAIHLDMDPSRLDAIPANALVDIASPTVFGAKQVQFVFPAHPSAESLRAGQVVDARHVMVEVNTVFEQLTSVLSQVEPAKLNATLAAIASAVSGRGEKFGRMLSDLDAYLATLEESLPALRADLQAAPGVLRAYADATPGFVTIADNATRISDSIVDQQSNLDAALVSVTGLADIGNQVLGENRNALTDVLRLLVPTTDLLNEYNQALWCGLAGMVETTHLPPLKQPGVVVLAGFLWAQERYRYPQDLPKAGAEGGPQCTGLPKPPFEAAPPYVVADTGTNPWRRTYPGVVLNSDLIKQIMFGDTEISGPPRNTAQIGQPG